MEIKGIFYFDPSDRIYADHFPGNPVVPGSLIVNAFLEAGRDAGFETDECIIKDFRFREFVSPDEHAFSIQILSDRLECRLYQNRSYASKALVTGTIKK
jgi:3-hydroxyacyl-[acyl-carrier-protein] dehydratase